MSFVRNSKRVKSRKKQQVMPTPEQIYKRAKMNAFLRSMGAQIITDQVYQCNLAMLQCLGWIDENHLRTGLQLRALENRIAVLYEFPVGKISEIYSGKIAFKSGEKLTTEQEAECEEVDTLQKKWKEAQHIIYIVFKF